MSQEGSGFAPPVSRTAYVADRIRDDVANGVIRPGELIKQTVLAKRYGVSPTPVREALRMLEADGVISYSPHKGASVRQLSPDAARDLYRLRAAAEQAAAVMAVERMTPAGLELLKERHAQLTEAQQGGRATAAELSVLNREFHFALYRQSSPLVAEYIEALWVRFTPAATIWTAEHSAALRNDHDLILKAVLQGDAEKAGSLTAAHIQRAAAIREHEPDLRAAGSDKR
ncbi:GntR family transcriptional regulator [Streptomyces roseirectus]|uniref:GntR family transcriptional regulator n=1 Tax=Streptomyces roseirectus TaxID=2768066 RepID=A0A7H0IQ42_9ACTN|nr:GntR family transcriptional regulator [Streptomyces roseirectus]QNP74908.1 GntR family transcriptional regulator [Streptomyces roseirectus]